ncbi:hypothetical protein [Propionibacterium australiense]|nr:hypothetical protein [Propionibacterium australiense]
MVLTIGLLVGQAVVLVENTAHLVLVVASMFLTSPRSAPGM